MNNSEKIATNGFINSRQLGDEIGNEKSFFAGLIYTHGLRQIKHRSADIGNR